MTVPNKGIYLDGYEAAFAKAPETEHDYKEPHLLFQRFSWLSGYAAGLGDYQAFLLENTDHSNEPDE